MDNLSANVVGAVLATGFRYWAFGRFVFRRRTGEARHGRRMMGRMPVMPVTPVMGAEVSAQASGAGPEVGPGEAELVEHQPEQGHADPDDVVWVARDAGDERTP